MKSKHLIRVNMDVIIELLGEEPDMIDGKPHFRSGEIEDAVSETMREAMYESAIIDWSYSQKENGYYSSAEYIGEFKIYSEGDGFGEINLNSGLPKFMKHHNEQSLFTGLTGEEDTALRNNDSATIYTVAYFRNSREWKIMPDHDNHHFQNDLWHKYYEGDELDVVNILAETPGDAMNRFSDAFDQWRAFVAGYENWMNIIKLPPDEREF